MSSVHELFERQVANTPDKTALEFEGQGLSYAQLNARANAIARRLSSLGIGAGALVGLCLHRSADMVAALLGILKVGAAYVPIDPDYPTDRIGFMLRDSGVSLIVSRSWESGRVADCGASVFRLEEVDSSTVSDHATAVPANPDDLAYVIYTSGSTGKPKGVQVHHNAVVNFLASMAREPGLDERDTLLAVTTLSFDIAVLELLLPLVVGAKVVVASREVAADGVQLGELLIDSGASVMQATPATWRMLFSAGWTGNQTLKALCGGEALPRDLARQLVGSVSSVWNMYGPTETTVWSTCYHVVDPDGDILIGHPIANTQIYVLDDEQSPVTYGEPGELYIGGAGVTKGYLNRPELTAERFVPDHFSGTPGAKLYRTGDLVVLLPDGNLAYKGRLDNQVKIRGFRVELGEIESVLDAYPAVEEAVVVAREDTPGRARLVAYLRASGSGLSIPDVRRHLQDFLPDYMMPAAFVRVDDLPRTPNGKTDRRALPVPEQKRPELEQSYTPPGDDLERHLAKRWSELLMLDRVGVHDPFFELGGDSIQAAEFINELQQLLGEQIFIITVFENPTVAEYGAFLKREYADQVTTRFGPMLNVSGSGSRPIAAFERDGEIDHTAVNLMREYIPVLSDLSGRAQQNGKNPPAMFILSPPRSGTTLLRVMLAGHPKLFAAPELQLLGFHTMAERRTAYRGKYSLWLEGAVRAVMEIKNCDGDEAKRIIEDCEDRDITTKEFYRLLQDWLEGRTLVDKTPSYALDLKALRKAEEDFSEPLYIHLLRHPSAMVQSFERYRMAQVMYLREHSFSAHQLAELIWLVSHENIIDFLRTIPSDRQCRVRFEDLVNRPQSGVEHLCNTLGLEFHEGLLEPYENLDRKMTDGVHSGSKPMGDTNFLERTQIDPNVADRWRTGPAVPLGEITWRMAEHMGYERLAAPQAAGSASSGPTSRRERLARRRRGRT